MKRLTPAILRELQFIFKIHMNGGDEFSTYVRANESFGLTWTRKSDGCPEYNLISSTLTVDEAPDLEMDLTKADQEAPAFCEAYNKHFNL